MVGAPATSLRGYVGGNSRHLLSLVAEKQIFDQCYCAEYHHDGKIRSQNRPIPHIIPLPIIPFIIDCIVVSVVVAAVSLTPSL